ncbi:MAG TPA: DUF2267 domain-containing protein [Candidatus Eisenbacteria bacterium]|nr:DUF2267 domain-containing protein [Candidatus Eisenbacteria bacterium]
MVTDVVMVERSAETMREWLNDLAAELGRPGDQQYAYRVLRGFMHTLRDRLPVNETAQFAAQLPELLRGVYYEGWRPSATPQGYHDLDVFLDHVAEQSLLAGETEASYAAEAAARVMARHISAGELDKVRLVLPRDIAAFLSSERLGRAKRLPDPRTEQRHADA